MTPSANLVSPDHMMALRLYQLHPDDRSWLMQTLVDESRERLQFLLDELATMGLDSASLPDEFHKTGFGNRRDTNQQENHFLQIISNAPEYLIRDVFEDEPDGVVRYLTGLNHAVRLETTVPDSCALGLPSGLTQALIKVAALELQKYSAAEQIEREQPVKEESHLPLVSRISRWIRTLF